MGLAGKLVNISGTKLVVGKPNMVISALVRCSSFRALTHAFRFSRTWKRRETENFRTDTTNMQAQRRMYADFVKFRGLSESNGEVDRQCSVYSDFVEY